MRTSSLWEEDDVERDAIGRRAQQGLLSDRAVDSSLEDDRSQGGGEKKVYPIPPNPLLKKRTMTGVIW